jgi:DNA-damage-inducible protein D
MQEDTTRIAVFRQKTIRRTLYYDEWWFVITDVITALTDSKSPRDYLTNMRKRDTEFEVFFKQGSPGIAAPQALEVPTAGGVQKLLCWNTEALFRMVQSIPSPKAEPFKLWLAKVGYERVREIEDPERATKRTRALYKAKGYSDDWIERRMRGIAIREELTEEWHDRGVQGREYGILTSEIARATFGVTPSEHKKLKGLKRQNLRDHMTDLEQIFGMLGEASTTEIVRSEDARGFAQNKRAARRGGAVAGNARKQLEQETGQPVVTPQNYLAPKSHPKKRLM